MQAAMLRRRYLQTLLVSSSSKTWHILRCFSDCFVSTPNGSTSRFTKNRVIYPIVLGDSILELMHGRIKKHTRTPDLGKISCGRFMNCLVWRTWPIKSRMLAAFLFRRGIEIIISIPRNCLCFWWSSAGLDTTISICVRTTLEGMLFVGPLAFAGLCGTSTRGTSKLCHMRSWFASFRSLDNFTM